MMRRAARTDANHATVRDGLRGDGWDVGDLSDCGHGIPDLVVKHPEGLIPLFLEVKDGDKPPSARKLTKAEENWQRSCGAITVVVLSLEEARKACNKHLGKPPIDKQE